MNINDLLQSLLSSNDKLTIKLTIEISAGESIDTTYETICDRCGWQGNGYTSPSSAARGLRTHKAQHCTGDAQDIRGNDEDTGWIRKMQGGK